MPIRHKAAHAKIAKPTLIACPTLPRNNPPIGVLPCANSTLMLSTRPRNCSGVFNCNNEFVEVAHVIPVMPSRTKINIDNENDVEIASAPSNTLNNAPLINIRRMVIVRA